MVGGRRTAVLVALLLIAGASAPVSASFGPTLGVFTADPTPSANSNVRTVTSVAAGDAALGSWSAFLPDAWDVKGDSQVTTGDLVAQGTMSVDTDCDGSINNY